MYLANVCYILKGEWCQKAFLALHGSKVGEKVKQYEYSQWDEIRGLIRAGLFP